MPIYIGAAYQGDGTYLGDYSQLGSPDPDPPDPDPPDPDPPDPDPPDPDPPEPSDPSAPGAPNTVKRQSKSLPLSVIPIGVTLNVK